MAKNTLPYLSRAEVPWFKQVALITLTLAVITYATIIVVRFITPLTWGITLAVTINPLYKRILKSFAYPSLIAGLFTLILGFGVIIPTVWASEVFVSAVLRGIESLGAISLPSLWRDFLILHPQFGDVVTHVLNIVPLYEIINRLSAVVEAQAQHLLRYSIESGVHALITLGIVFFMLKDHTLFFRTLKTLTPLPSNETEILFTRILDTIQGVIFGVVAVALIQGFLGWYFALVARNSRRHHLGNYHDAPCAHSLPWHLCHLDSNIALLATSGRLDTRSTNDRMGQHYHRIIR